MFHESFYVSYSYILKFYNFQETTFENAKNYLPSKNHITFTTFFTGIKLNFRKCSIYDLCYNIN